MADLKTKIKDLEFQRAELLSQRSSKRSSRSSKSSTTSSARRAAIEAATLKEKMKSLQRKQEIDRKQDELERQQRELQRQEEEEDLRAELNAAEAIKGLLAQDTEEEKPKAIEDITRLQDPFDITQLSHFTPKRNDIIVSKVTPPTGSCMVVKPDTGNPVQQHTGNPTQENIESQGLMEFSEKFTKGKPPPTTNLYDDRKTQEAIQLTGSSRTDNAEKKKEPNAKSLAEERPPKPAVNPQEYAVDVQSSNLAPLTFHGGHSSLPTHFDVNTPVLVPQPRIGSTPAISHMPPSMNNLDASWQFQSIQRENAEIQRQQVHLLRRLMLPSPKPPIFEGDILEYPKWESAFEALIEEDGDPSRKLYYLGQYTGGVAQKSINGLLGLRTEDAYSRARKILKERYGNPYRIYEEYRKKLFSWPTCNSGTELQELSDFLMMTQETMKTVGYLKELNSLTFIRQLATRLPSFYCNRWRESARKIEDQKKDYTFDDLVEFVQYAASDATHPVFSQESLNLTKREIQRSSTPIRSSPRRSQANEKPQSRGTAFATVSEPAKTRTCPCCEEPHLLEECKKFLQKTTNERKEFVKSKRLCFRCLKRGHMVRECRGRQRCKTCSKPHATVLHEESSNASVEKGGEPPTQERGESAISNCIKAKQPSRRNAATCSLIVPVWLKHQDNPQRKIEVYAILDDQSDVCFITDRVRKDLGLKGTEVQLELSTMRSVEIIDTLRIDGMEVMRNDEKVEISLPKTYSREVIPAKREQIPTPEVASRWKHLQRIADKIQPYREDLPIGILIGNSCVRAIKPRDVIPGKSNDPYAIRTTLGWGIIGPASPEGTHEGKVLESAACHRITSTEITSKTASANKLVPVKQHKEVMKPEAIRTLLEQDFKDGQVNTKPLSQEDLRFLRTMKEGIHLTEDQHYEMPLPLREGNIDLPFNRKQVENRLQQLRKRLERDSKYKEDYTKFMEDMITNGYAEKAPQTTTAKWYIPHHGVYNPRKPGKIRVVFDCSAEFNGHSLNSHLMQGPDLTNSLIGVLCRFRQERTAIACDIEGMFHQVRVNSEHRDFLRFLWWEYGNTSQEPQEFRMRVHLFGATSSPGCANLALKTTADDNEAELGQEPANFLRKNFYVDDGLKSVNSEDHAIKLIETTKQLCKRGGFRLHKFTSNSKTVIETIAEEDRAKGIKNIDLDKQPLPLERVLGVEWCTESDNLKFRITLKDKPLTRRGVLATVSSIYDPLGLAAPFLLKGKRILQRLCKENVEWDDPIPQDLRAQWEKWRGELHLLEELSVPRCFLPADFGELKNVELHHFSDASNEGYGQCSYLRLVDEHDKINCSLVMGKARVAPLKPFTIPRLELTAALVSVKTSEVLAQELEYPSPEETFWTDSMVVKAYIQNDARRFHTFVANRVQQIRNSTDPNQWVYVASEDNPADDASRGLSAAELTHSSRWISGPQFLWEPRERWNLQELTQEPATLAPDDKEVKKAYALTTATTPTQKWPTLVERISIFSDWFQAVRAIANCLRYLAILRDNVKLKKSTESSDQNPRNANKPMTTEELKNAEVKIIKEAQKVAFTEDVRTLSFNKETTKYSQLHRLDPFLDHDGILRVGGRIKHSPMPEEIKHPAILPRKGQVTEMLLRHLHNKSDHQGRGVTVNEVRSSGFWIIGCTSAVSELLLKCTICRKLRAETQKQKMADLPPERLSEAPPFTYSGVDYFGPWIVKNGRKEEKRYGVIFTCMASRAVHLEVAHSLDSDSFINALRRFICRRGPVRQLRSDQGTNFIGARRELKEALAEMDHRKVATEALKMNCDWVETKLNVPSASHMGGVWERQIRSIRNVLAYLLQRNGAQLNDEALVTFMCEAESMVNSRPLTTDNLASPESLEPLTPNHILTMKTKVVLPPPGAFQTADKYSRKMWRRVQHLSNEFWTRWRKEFLQSLQQRTKWSRPQKNLKPGDIVIVKDADTPRNTWRLARITEVHVGDDKLVRTVKLLVGDRNLRKDGTRTRPLTILERPIHKLVLLLPGDETGDREAPSESHE